MKNHDGPRSPLVDATIIMSQQDEWGYFDIDASPPVQKIRGFYETWTHVNNTYTVQLEEEGQAIDDLHFTRHGNKVATPDGFANDVAGAEAYAKQVWGVE